MGSGQRHSDEVAGLLRSILDAPGLTDSTQRHAAFEVAGDDDPGSPLGRYLALVRSRSAFIGDALVDEVRADGVSDDEIFELTLATAAGEAFRRLDAGLRAMGVDS